MLRTLAPHLIRQIAAGEIIDGPSAVVKELVENAIDAGASKIEIVVQDGGKYLISIKDNGVGIHPDDLSLCLKRYTTSKFPQNENIFSIATMGFRGEALPAIAAISRLNIISHPNGYEHAWEINAHDDFVSDARPTSGPLGTHIIVRDLFFNTPVRLKFLKSNGVELNKILSLINRFAIFYHEINWILRNGEKVLLAYPESSQKERLANILGHSWQESAIKVLHEEGTYQLQGFLAPASYHLSSSKEQYFFVNKRLVRDKQISLAIKNAYHDIIPAGKHPQLVLFLTVPMDEIDINYHPKKTEIQFQKPEAIRSFIQAVLKKFLAPNLNNALEETALQSFSILQENQTFYQQEEFSFKDHPLGLARAQIAKTYIVAENQDNLILVDQHAAHERIVYEILKNNAKQYVQKLLLPMLIRMPLDQVLKVLLYQEELMHFGIEIKSHPLGIEVLSTPAILPLEGIKDFLFNFEVGKQDLLHILANIACKNSIKSGDELNLQQMNSLLRQMENTPNASTCNHGRPVVVILDKKKLDKLFQR